MAALESELNYISANVPRLRGMQEDVLLGAGARTPAAS
jgi:hypothetical protein